MNLVTSLVLRDDESALVENAVRLALDSIVNVLCGVTGSRSREHRRTVEHRDAEIRRLESRLRGAELELRVLRAQGCTCGLSGPWDSGDPQRAEQTGPQADRVDPRRSEISVSLGVLGRPPSHVSSQSRAPGHPPTSPSGTFLDQACFSGSRETSGASETSGRPSASPGGRVVKEEPCDAEAVLIKWEMSEDGFGDQHQGAGTPCQEHHNLTVNDRHENLERNRVCEKLRADPGGHQIPEGEHLRSESQRRSLSELPDEAQRVRRAAWRLASRRYYARKVARQRAGPSHSAHFRHVPGSPYSQPFSFVDKRRKCR